MERLIFTDRDGQVNVQYKVDALSEDFENFTVYQVDGLEDAEIRAGIQFRQLAYSKTEFIEFATEKNLKLEYLPLKGSAVTLRDFDESDSFSISLSDFEL